MANKRMFSLDIIDTDKFLEMKISAQGLYFHLGMRADDDGFVSSPKKIMKLVNCTMEDLEELIDNEYIISFNSGIVIISDWNINNNKIKADRYKETRYKDEYANLTTVNGRYILGSNMNISNSQNSNNLQQKRNQNGAKVEPLRKKNGNSKVPNGNQNGIKVEPIRNHKGTNTEPQNRLDKNRIEKYSCEFEAFWKLYPRKIGKAKAYKCWKTRLKDGYSSTELTNSLMSYVSEIKERGTEERYIKHASTFLGSDKPFLDYIDRAKEIDFNDNKSLMEGSITDENEETLPPGVIVLDDGSRDWSGVKREWG